MTYRYIARRNERYVFPNLPPNWRHGFVKPSQAQGVGLENLEAERPVYVTPYGRMGFDQQARLSENGSEYRHPRDVHARLEETSGTT